MRSFAGDVISRNDGVPRPLLAMISGRIGNRSTLDSYAIEIGILLSFTCDLGEHDLDIRRSKAFVAFLFGDSVRLSKTNAGFPRSVRFALFFQSYGK